MKYFILLLSTFIFNFALAAEGDFATRKAEVLKHLEERITTMQTHKACVTAAQTAEALHACHEKMQTERLEERLERKKNKSK